MRCPAPLAPLGAALALQAYSNKTVYDKIHETNLYNPAYSPFLRG